MLKKKNNCHQHNNFEKSLTSETFALYGYNVKNNTKILCLRSEKKYFSMNKKKAFRTY